MKKIYYGKDFLISNKKDMFQCNECQGKTPLKLSKCPMCGSFSSLVDIGGGSKAKIEKKKEKKEISEGQVLEKQTFTKKVEGTYDISVPEIKRVFGKGVKKGGVYLLAGEPGIGKSTLLMQLLGYLKQEYKEINMAYFSGEENENQIEERKERLGIKFDTEIFNTSILEDTVATIKAKGFDFVIIDSIQTLESVDIDGAAGGIAQVKYVCSKITSFFKQNGITAIIIGHITKTGEVAGPKYLEHLVDTVMYLEGDRFGLYRFLRAKKNRFGPAEEVGIFSMDENGLTPINNYNDFITQDFIPTPGNVLTIGIDNGRPIIANIEVITTPTSYNFPQRKSIGISKERLELICAIFENKLQKSLGDRDIFLNIPGEIKFKDNGLDLAVFVALWSSIFGYTIEDKVFFGELTLMGKVQQTSFHNKRRKEVRGLEIVDYEKLNMISNIEDILKKE